MVPDRLWYHADCVVRGCPFSFKAQPAAKKRFSCKWEAAGWRGIVYCMFMFDWSDLISYNPPPKATLLTACVHFRDSYPIDVSIGIYLYEVEGKGGERAVTETERQGEE
jgi:hypothetical protein